MSTYSTRAVIELSKVLCGDGKIAMFFMEPNGWKRGSKSETCVKSSVGKLDTRSFVAGFKAMVQQPLRGPPDDFAFERGVEKGVATVRAALRSPPSKNPVENHNPMTFSPLHEQTL